MKRFFGKYKGKVVANLDPLQLGRVQVSVPNVLGQSRLPFAMPCVPYAGDGVGLLTLPPVGANVWVEFAEGDVDQPIWSGCFWATGQLASLNALLPVIHVLKTGSVTLTLSDAPGAGGLTIEVGPPAVTTPLKLVFDTGGIELVNGNASVKLTATSVSVNQGALEVI
jgi:type VI secretion system (T6SS) baseplate-like injector VgrG